MYKWYFFDLQMKSCKNSHTELVYVPEAFEYIVLDATLERQINKQSHTQRGSTAPPGAAAQYFPGQNSRAVSESGLITLLSFLEFHFHYLEKKKFPTASGNATTVSANPWLWKQSLVTNCCTEHRDSLTEKLPTNRHSLHFSCGTVAIPLLSCPQHFPLACFLHR